MNQFSQNIGYTAADMAGRPPTTPSTECGARLAALRKAAKLSQRELAETLDIPQRTVSFYERQATSLPSSLLPKLAEALDVPVETILGLEVADNGKGKRGPKSDLEKRFERIQKLPRKEQQFIIEMIDRVLGGQRQAS